MKVERLTSTTIIRNFCITHNFYGSGTNEEYANLLNKIVLSGEHITDNRVYKIAKDIFEHTRLSDLHERAIFDIDDMMELLLNSNVFVYVIRR